MLNNVQTIIYKMESYIYIVQYTRHNPGKGSIQWGATVERILYTEQNTSTKKIAHHIMCLEFEKAFDSFYKMIMTTISSSKPEHMFS